MSSEFEKEYYENDEFWKEGMIEDPFNKGRIDKTIELIPPEIQNLVDIGCGNGRLLSELKIIRPELKLLGIDRSTAALKYVQVDKIEADIVKTGLSDNSFDYVTCCEVIEHLPHEVFGQALNELARISSKYVLISVPYMENLAADQVLCPQCKSRFNKNLHLRSFSTEQMKNLLNDKGFKNVRMEYAGEMIRSYGSQLLKNNKQLEFNMPICPLCGYKNEQYKITPYRNQEISSNPGFIKKGFDLIKQVWPKFRSYYWIIALYEKQ